MSALVTVIHVIVCVILIIAVLLQSGKAADLAGAFGGAGSQTAFGPRGGASLLARVTEVTAILFMVTSLGLWVLSGKDTSSAVSGEKAVPVKPAAAETTKDSNPKPTAQVPAAVGEKDKKQPETKQPETKKPVVKAPETAAKPAAGQETKK